MSRIGRKAIDIPNGVAVTVAGQTVAVKGPLGDLSRVMAEGVGASVKDGKVHVTRDGNSWKRMSGHGLTRTLIANMIEGVSSGFFKELDIQGVGFKAESRGQTLLLSLGFSRPLEFVVPIGIKLTVDQGTAIKVAGADKALVGDVAARIRAFYPAEPYKGKGVRYRGQYVRRKVGKTVA
ncbi:MAG: 50S ribosomal protein L6 [Verrucomicrobiota bacterium]|nr:50S ribosomal protein L6 [Verrucomicrobiota bacterium]